MATKKKKKDTTLEDELLIATDAKSVMNMPSDGWPQISQGTHLTVKTFEDGHTELVWDDEQLLKEVREAIASIEQPAPKKTKGISCSCAIFGPRFFCPRING
mgnify:CR=1 FL=1